ncbi:MAG: serine hydrolase [Acidobacteria bacterium]|nr:serine hydrolase [Acidobacteriota bacterium]
MKTCKRIGGASLPHKINRLIKRIFVIALMVITIMPIAVASQTTGDKIPIKKADRVKKKTVRKKAVHLPSNRIAQQSGSRPKALKELFPSNASIREMIRENIPDAQSTGAVVGLLEPDGSRRVIAYGGSGLNARPLDGESVFEIGSVTKAFTGVLLADMVRRGEVKLTEPVARLLPADVRVPSRNGKEITLLDLATHTSGLPPAPANISNNPQGYNQYTIWQMYDFLAGYELSRDPGASFEYSNFVSLLGHALSLRAGKPYETLLKERVLAPFDMKQTAVTLTPEMKRNLTLGHDRFGDPQLYLVSPAFISSGRLMSTANDILDFAAANLAANKAGIYASLRDARQAHRPIGDSGEFMGLGWGVEDSQSSAAGLAGGTFGYGCYLYVDIKNRRAIVVMTNYATPGAADNQALALHMLDPAKFPRKKPSVGRAVAAVYRTNGVQAAVERYCTLRRTAPDGWNFDESELNSVGYWLLGRGSTKDAIVVFRLNVEMYPESPNPHDSLGDAYRAAGQLNKAIESYRKAVALSEKTKHPNLAGYRKSLESALKQLNSPK